MSTIKTKIVENSLCKKGFIRYKGDHHRFILIVDDKETAIHTKISHGEIELDNHLINRMSKQLYLSKDEFLALINCPLSYADYIEILRKKGKIGS